MRVGLNATCFNDRPSGARQRFVGIYGDLIRRLPEVEFLIYEPADCRVAAWFDGAANLSARRTTLPSEGRLYKAVCGLGFWRRALANDGLDVLEQFNLPLVRTPSGRSVLTIHDIRGTRPGHGRLERVVSRSVIGRGLRAADHVVTVSETMKQELLDCCPGVPISVVYNGVDVDAAERITAADVAAFRKKFDLSGEFILSVGHIERRKNYLRLVEAISRLRDRGTCCSLVIVGNDGGQRRILEERIESWRLSARVRILSGLTDIEVRCAYRLCSLFVFPSSYEGFGIPILEAMAARCPMVLSDIPVFREITENSGVYFYHDDVDALAAAVEDVLASSSERARLVEYGRRRVRAFSFSSVAATLADLYGFLG